MQIQLLCLQGRTDGYQQLTDCAPVRLTHLGVCEEEVHRALGNDLPHTILALVAATSLVVNFHLQPQHKKPNDAINKCMECPRYI